MSDPRFKNDDERNAYISVLEKVSNAIHIYENGDNSLEVNEDNYEEFEKQLQTDITNGNILKVNGYPIKKGTKPYDLFFPFIFGTAGEDYERGKNSIIFKVFNKPNDENYYSITVDKKGVQIGKEGKPLSDIKKDSEPDFEDMSSEEQIERNKTLTDQVHQKNAVDRKSFGVFADTLRKAAKTTSRDSDEYKGIIKLLDAFKDKVDFSNSKEPARSDWQKLDENQRLALPMVLLKEKIDNYLEHKAKDGIKQNTFNKLAAVEWLNQYIGQRIEEINPKDFNFLGKIRNTDCMKKTVEDELEAINKVRESNDQPKLPDKSWSDIDAAKYIQDSDDYNENLSLWEQSKMTAVARCMNRMILNVQKNHEGEKCDELVEKLEHTRSELIKHPLRSKKVIVENQNAINEKVNQFMI